jgi:peptidoglycan/LPS O-acetylase OafA/YrhL
MNNTSIIKYDYIDTLRGLAILSVVMVHSSQNFPPRSEVLIQIAAQGSRGVQLFFIASALTLFLSMDARSGDQEPRSLESFFIRRFFRIAPAFYLTFGAS